METDKKTEQDIVTYVIKPNSKFGALKFYSANTLLNRQGGKYKCDELKVQTTKMKHLHGSYVILLSTAENFRRHSSYKLNISKLSLLNKVLNYSAKKVI